MRTLEEILTENLEMHAVRFGHQFEAADDDEFCAACRRDGIERGIIDDV